MNNETTRKSPKKRKWLIFILILLFLILVLSILYLLFQRTQKKITEVIPEEFLLTVLIEDPLDVWDEFEASTIWQGLAGTPLHDDIQAQIQDTKQNVISESYLKLLKMVFNKKLVLMIPDLKDESIKFVAAVDLGLKIKLFQMGNRFKIQFLPEGEEIAYSQRDFEGVKIESVQLLAQKEIYAYCFIKNILLVSNHESSLEKCILTANGQLNSLSQNDNFRQVQANIEADTRIQIYLNGQKAQPLLNDLLTREAASSIEFLTRLIEFTGLGLKIDQNRLIIQGFSALNRDAATPEIKKLLTQTGQESDLVEFIPADAASFGWLSFDEFDALWQFTKTQLQRDRAAWNEFESSQQLAKKYLGLEFERDLLSWVGSEIGTFNLPTENFQTKPEAVLLLGVKELAQARNSLNQLKQSVSDRLPINFKEKNYKGILISYMDLPFFLKVFFGGLFKETTKPYWCILGDYVVFSDNMENLEYVIDAHLSKSSLNYHQDFMEIKEVMPEDRNATFYFDTQRLITSLRPNLSREIMKNINQLQTYLERLKAIGISLANKNNGLEEFFVFSIQQKNISAVTLKWQQALGAGIAAPIKAAQLDDQPGLEIIAATENGQVQIFQANGRVLTGWPKSVGEKIQASPAVGDLDGDGKNEVIVVSGKQIYAWHGYGRAVNGWPVSVDGTIVGAPSLIDVDGDQKLEILIGAWDRGVYLFNSAGQRLPGWPQMATSLLSASPLAADLNADGRLEIIAAGIDGKIMCWNQSGEPLANWPISTNSPITASPVAADLNRDGQLEIIVGTLNGKCYAFTANGDTLDGWPQNAEFIISATPSLANVDRKGGPEVLAGAENRKLFIWQADGELLDGWPQSTRGKIKSSPVVADINGDNEMEIIVAADDGKLYCWNSAGQMLNGWPRRGSCTPAVGDFDEDGDMDLVVGSWDRNLYFYDLTGAFNPEKIEWGSFRGDGMNRGIYR
jgi:hypothetical protein